MRKLVGAWMVLGGALVAACGGASSGEADPDEAGGSGPGVGGAGAGSGTSTETGSGIGGGFTTSGSAAEGTGTGTGGSQSCAGETVKAELAPLDMYVMFDSSGSMAGKTGSGATKWDAVTQAMKAFVQSPGSSGLGIGLEFFPLNKPGVPESCNAPNQCGESTCLLGICGESTNNNLYPCESDSDCFYGCYELGACTTDPSYLCLVDFENDPSYEGSCKAQGLGTCQKLAKSSCIDATTCEIGDYASPAVPIAPLPASSAAIASALDAKDPTGGTPTRVALSGAVEHAKSWAAANPTHKVVVLLATDGLPTECLKSANQSTAQAIGDVAAVASSGLSGAPSVPTFVIGVFTEEENQTESAQANLDKIAAAGGTDKAFIVNASGDVTQPFIDALNKIRGTALSCEYQLPPPPDGKELDFKKVNVQYTSESGEAQTIPYVATEAGCKPGEQGWYYDVPPDSGEPTKILVCPETCELFQSGGEVDIQIGCETQTTVPK